jgi:transcriptional regulator with XRE-family HTH domain
MAEEDEVDAQTARTQPTESASTPGQQDGPTVSRIVLGTQLRRLREAAGISREAAGHAIRASHAKISRLELGRVGFKERDIVDLLALYGVTDDDERAQIMSLMRQANTRGWWQQHSDVLPSWFEMYLRLEQEAQSVRTFEAQLLPGLLQSEAYARAVIRLFFPSVPAHEVDRRAQMRLTRQKVLMQPSGPRLWAIVDESALNRPVGSNAVMRAQLEHILDITAQPNVTMQVLPFLAGGHAAMGGPFTILRFAQSELPDIVYLEQYNSATYLDRRADVEDYLWAMERLGVAAMTPVQSRARVRELLAAL